MPEPSDDEVWRQIVADNQLWESLLSDGDFWRQVNALPSDEAARLCIERLKAMGFDESPDVQALRVRQMGVLAAIVEKVGRTRAIEMLRRKPL